MPADLLLDSAVSVVLDIPVSEETVEIIFPLRQTGTAKVTN